MIGIQISIIPTDRYATVDGARCHVWDGLTPLGSRGMVYVRWIDVRSGQDTREFDVLPTEPGPPTIEPVEARGGRRDEGK